MPELVLYINNIFETIIAYKKLIFGICSTIARLFSSALTLQMVSKKMLISMINS
jgi:hypothetical protein